MTTWDCHGTRTRITRRAAGDRIYRLRKQHNQGAIKRMQSGADVPTEVVYTALNNHLEAIGNQALNIIQNAELLTGKGTLRVDDV